MSRKILDSKSICQDNAATIAEWCFEMFKKGYEPMPMQCVKQYGQMVITVGLFEKEEIKIETTEEQDVSASGTGSDSEVSGEEIKGVNPEGEEQVETKPEVKAKPKTRQTKPKVQ